MLASTEKRTKRKRIEKKSRMKCGWTMWTDFEFTECVENSSVHLKEDHARKTTTNKIESKKKKPEER